MLNFDGQLLTTLFAGGGVNLRQAECVNSRLVMKNVRRVERTIITTIVYE